MWCFAACAHEPSAATFIPRPRAPTGSPSRMPRRSRARWRRASIPIAGAAHPVRGGDGPIVGRLVRRIDPDEEYGEDDRDAKERKQRKEKGRSAAAEQDSEQKIGD